MPAYGIAPSRAGGAPPERGSGCSTRVGAHSLLGMPNESMDRPWGSWHVIEDGQGYKVKRIVVKPGSRLSLQTHKHRSEHWVVIFGIATCQVDDRKCVAGPGECIDVPRGAVHRLANEHSEDLQIIEVQQGAYTGEDDICRLEDDFGRSDGAAEEAVQA